jgi:hypothetical protein
MVDYSSLMVESDVEVLAKEERRLEVILAAVPLQSSLGGDLHPLIFSCPVSTSAHHEVKS